MNRYEFSPNSTVTAGNTGSLSDLGLAVAAMGRLRHGQELHFSKPKVSTRNLEASLSWNNWEILTDIARAIRKYG